MDQPNIPNSNDSSKIWVNTFEDSDVKDFIDSIDENLQDNPDKPIMLHINSDGGSVHNCFAMLDYMDSVRSMASEAFKFITIAKGRAFSAGALLLSHGDYRFATPNTSIMLHQVQSGFWGSQPENKVQFEEIERVNAKLLTILKENCKLDMSIKELETQLMHDMFLTPENARSFGLIDIVGYPKVNELRAFELTVLNGKIPAKNEKPIKTKSKSTGSKLLNWFKKG